MYDVKALVVDDSLPMRRAIVDLLRGIDGCLIVGEGANGIEALQLAQELRPDLVVMDIHMPMMGGFEALALLRRQIPSARVVLVTTVLEPGVQEKALTSGAIACFEKGVEVWRKLPAIVLHISEARQAEAPSIQDRV